MSERAERHGGHLGAARASEKWVGSRLSINVLPRRLATATELDRMQVLDHRGHHLTQARLGNILPALDGDVGEICFGSVGKMSNEKRQEFILASDVLAASMLVNAINNRLATGATPSTVEGPFHIPDSPQFADGEDLSAGAPGIPCFITGKVTDLDGKPIGGVVLDIWQTDGEGLYEAQRAGKDQYMRGVYRSKPDGSYIVRTVAPIGYTIPMDGPVGELLKRTHISEYRPAHIHFCLEAPGYHRIVTHLFQRGHEYLDIDVVYAVKEPLITDFVSRPAGAEAPTGQVMDGPFYEVHYDFRLQKAANKVEKAA